MDGLRFKSRNNLHNIKMSDEAVSISNTVGSVLRLVEIIYKGDDDAH